MACEMCGSCGKLVNALIDGVDMIVCEKCAGYGQILNKPRAQTVELHKRKIVSNMEKKYDDQVKSVESIELVENYGTVIRRAREKAGLTISELAQKIFEKDSILKKVENQDLEPTEKMIIKLEKFLAIELLVKIKGEGMKAKVYNSQDEPVERTSSSMDLSEFVNIKIKKKK